MLEKGYLIKSGYKAIATDKLHGVIVEVDVKPSLNITPMSLKQRFRKFIVDANVPRYLEQGGSKILANASSKDAEKAFEVALEQVAYDTLVAATKAYYATNNNKLYRKIIGNYFKEGIWELMVEDYLNGKLKPSSETGNRGNTLVL